MARARRSGGGFGKMLLGFVLGAMVVAGAGFAYFKYKRKSMLKMDGQVFVKKRLPGPAPKPPLDGEARKPPFGISEDLFEAGAHVYKARCASCHGTPDRDAALARTLHPPPAQLWSKYGKPSGQAPGAIYGHIANGIPGSGMPAYRQTLPETALWQVSLLLANAGKPLPEPVKRILGSP